MTVEVKKKKTKTKKINCLLKSETRFDFLKFSCLRLSICGNDERKGELSTIKPNCCDVKAFSSHLWAVGGSMVVLN